MIELKQWFARPTRFVEPALTGLAALAGLAVLITAVQAVRERAAVHRLSQTYTQLTGVPPSSRSAQAPPRDEMVKRISTHRLIAPPPPFQLTGVLGDAAVFNGSMALKAGQSAGDMKILVVGASWVEVEQNGQTQKLYVFQPSMFSASSPAMPRKGPLEPNAGVSPVLRQTAAPLPVVKAVSQP